MGWDSLNWLVSVNFDLFYGVCFNVDHNMLRFDRNLYCGLSDATRTTVRAILLPVLLGNYVTWYLWSSSLWETCWCFNIYYGILILDVRLSFAVNFAILAAGKATTLNLRFPIAFSTVRNYACKTKNYWWFRWTFENGKKFWMQWESCNLSPSMVTCS